MLVIFLENIECKVTSCNSKNTSEKPSPIFLTLKFEFDSRLVNNIEVLKDSEKIVEFRNLF